MNKLLLKIFITASMLFLSIVSNADFIGKKGATFNNHGDYWYQEFTLNGTRKFDFFFASDYKAQAIVFDKSQLNSFKNNGSVSYYEGFDSKFGIRSVTLSAGNYVVGVRNLVSGKNTYSLEFEYSPPEIDNAEYYDTYLTKTENVSAGGWLIQPFTVQGGYKFVIEGCNTGIYSYLIDKSDISSFKNNNQFSYYVDYSSDSSDPNSPGLMTLNLSPGDYALAFRNNNSNSKALVYRFYRYRTSSNPIDPTSNLADLVFNDIENQYGQWFSPHQTSQTYDEYYYRYYSNDSYLLEWNGDLWYNIEGEGWNKWGAISQW